MESPKAIAVVDGGASLGMTTVTTRAHPMKVGDTILTVGKDGKPVTLTVISVPKTGNRHERRKARAERRG